ncbi:hypothetical protein [Lonsdalea quercina]|uniref:hypothetical protein n=1 Tax=Lonsdalea quercina TaxID=71657 RepID=UPI0039763066
MSKSFFRDQCWRCWPAFCKCQPQESEVGNLRGEIFLLDRELQRENRRAREFGDVIKSLVGSINRAACERMNRDGLEDLPEDLLLLREKARNADEILSAERNADRTTELYKQLTGKSK